MVQVWSQVTERGRKDWIGGRLSGSLLDSFTINWSSSKAIVESGSQSWLTKEFLVFLGTDLSALVFPLHLETAYGMHMLISLLSTFSWLPHHLISRLDLLPYFWSKLVKCLWESSVWMIYWCFKFSDIDYSRMNICILTLLNHHSLNICFFSFCLPDPNN